MNNDKQKKARREETKTEERRDHEKNILTEVNVAESKARKWEQAKKDSRGGGY